MRKFGFVVALAAAVLFSGIAQAATVDVVAKEVAPGDWRLLYTSVIDLTTVQATAGPNTLGITFTSPPVDVPFSFAGDFGLGGLSISASNGTLALFPAGVGIELGTFSGPVTALGPDLASGGVNATDAAGIAVADVAYMVMPIVPEPSSIILMGLALGGLAFARRRA